MTRFTKRNFLFAVLAIGSLFLFGPQSVAAQTGVYVLNPAGEGEFSGTVTVKTSYLYVNGTFNPHGDAEVVAAVANVGTVTNESNFTGTLNTGVFTTVDPLALLPTPTWDPAADLGGVFSSGGDTIVLAPGFYSAGITLTSYASVFLQPGVYILDGAGLDIGGQAEIVGVGVTIFITGTGIVDMTGGGVVDLTPTFGGVYDDILLFVDRETGADVDLSGAGKFKTNGKIYAPASTVNITGAAGTNGDPKFGFLLVAHDLRLGGTGEISFLRLPNGIGVFD